MPPRLAVRTIDFFERAVCFSRPFRFGAVVVTSAAQVFARVEIEIEGGRTFVGASAELLVPKWFDKRAHLSPDQTVDELRRSLEISRGLYLASSAFDTAFGYHASRVLVQIEACAKEDIPPLAAIFGPSEINKAIIDALLRGAGVDFFKGMAANIAGIDARLAPDLRSDDITRFLAQCQRQDRVAIRHTIGLDDAIEGEGGVADVNENSGARYFKLKLAGNPEADATRLARIGRALAKLPYDYRVTLDANEQYSDLVSLQDLLDRLRTGALEPIANRLLYIEQPLPRDLTRAVPLGALAHLNFIIDEADDSYNAFPAARSLGYRGVSLKSCKGTYKSIVNATRAAKWSTAREKFFTTGEDLTCQAGLAVQQDLALGALVGLSHMERNGHHYVDGFADTPAEETSAFLAAHPDLYARRGGQVRLAIHDGDLLTDSLVTRGFAAGAHPRWSTMSPLRQAKVRTVQEQIP